MSKKINGKVYMLVDVIVRGGLIYEVYEDEKGSRKYIYCDYVR